MDAPVKADHKFNIWNLAGVGAAPERKGPESADADRPNGVRAPRGLTDRSRHSAARSVRPTLRPFDGRCVLADGQKLSCKTRRICPERIDIAYKDGGTLSSGLTLAAKIVLDLDYFGVIRGSVQAMSEAGFSLAPDIVYHEMLVAKLAELHGLRSGAESERGDLDRLTARVTLRNPACVYRVVESDAVIYRAKIALLSHKVATLRTAHIQRTGTRVLLGWPNAIPGTVARSFESGFTIEFDEMLEELHENLYFG